jgi:MFS family permease
MFTAPAPAPPLARALAARGIHYGWAMAALTFVYAVFSSSALGVPSVLIVPMAKDLGWSIGELSAPQGLRLALFGLAAPLAGGLMLRYGPRRMVAISGTLLLVGLAISVATTEKWQLWLGMGVLLGLAPGLTAMQLNAVVGARWFVAHRGLVLGLLGGAVATGTLVFMPLAAWVAERWGWRVAMLIPSVGTAVSWLLFLWLARDRPQDLDLPAVGEAAVAPVPPTPAANFVALSAQALSLGSKRPVFWILAATFAICGVSSFGITQAHLVPFCGDLGVPLGTAAWLMAVIGICDLIGTIGSGWLSDRYDNRWCCAVVAGECPADDGGSHDLRGHLWAGLHRDGTAVGTAHRRHFRSRDGAGGLCMDLRGTPCRGRRDGLRNRRQPGHARHVRARLPARRCALLCRRVVLLRGAAPSARGGLM